MSSSSPFAICTVAHTLTKIAGVFGDANTVHTPKAFYLAHITSVEIVVYRCMLPNEFSFNQITTNHSRQNVHGDF